MEILCLRNLSAYFIKPSIRCMFKYDNNKGLKLKMFSFEYFLLTFNFYLFLSQLRTTFVRFGWEGPQNSTFSSESPRLGSTLNPLASWNTDLFGSNYFNNKKVSQKCGWIRSHCSSWSLQKYFLKKNSLTDGFRNWFPVWEERRHRYLNFTLTRAIYKLKKRETDFLSYQKYYEISKIDKEQES